MDGYTFCGERALTVTDAFTGLEATDIELDEAAGLLTFTATEEGQFIYALSYHLIEYPDRRATQLLSFEVVNPCPTSTLDEVSLPETEYELKVGKSLSLGLLKPKDSASKAYGEMNGYSFCGPRSIKFTSSSD